MLSNETVFAHGPWYQDKKSLFHNCVYCRCCGAIHDTIGSFPLIGLIKMALGRVPSKVILTYDPSSFRKIVKMNNPEFPVNVDSIHPLILEAMLEDERLSEEDLAGHPPTMDFLIDCTQEKDWIVRREAVAGLARFRTKEAVDIAIGMLHDKHWDVRKYAARTLGRLGDLSAIDPLKELLHREVWEYFVRKEAILALKKLQAQEQAS